MKYNHQKIEKKWQRIWEKNKTYEPDLKKAKKPFYNLMMFPYPSAEGLHIGNMYAFTGSDIYGRFKRMQGYDVFEPIGLDGFGIHSENYALKIGVHPARQAKISKKRFYRQLKAIGNAFAWNERLETYDPEYYKWTQWIFVQMFKKGLAYRKKALVNWCLSCKTVLADEQVIAGKCERCSSEVLKKELEQWFFKITKYADRLLKNLEKLDWSEKIKITQRNWIGKSEDIEIIFSIKNSKEKLPIVTTRADTIFGATFMILAPEHKLIDQLKDRIKNWEEIKQYREKILKKTEFERELGEKKKTGAQLKGVFAINPVNNKEVPVFIANYVLATYGTGAIMGVPAHDDRDFAFAKKFKLPVIFVIEKPKTKDVLCVYIYDNDFSIAAQFLRDIGKPKEYWTPTQRRYDINLKEVEKILSILKQTKIGIAKQWEAISNGQSFALEMNPVSIDFGAVYTGDGKHINSGFLNGFDTKDAIKKMLMWLKKRNLGRATVHYHLRDWLISRQRYWGPPIPMIYCEKCGWQSVLEKNLPVILPYVENFQPKGNGKPPLATDKKFYEVKCPVCGKMARRETDVSDIFLDSSWYYFRYPSINAKNSKLEIKNLKLEIPWNQEITRQWCPVDIYIGGPEHAILHLLYVRFIAMVFYDLKLINFEEPFKKFRAHGLLIKEGAKMSKSKGNILSPDDYIKKFGADVLRMYLMFLAPFEQGGDFYDSGILGIARFLEKARKLYNNNLKDSKIKNKFADSNKFAVLDQLLHQTIKKVTEDIENLKFNTAISALMILVNEMEKQSKPQIANYELFLKLLSPFAPHLSEELWQQLKKIRVNPLLRQKNPRQSASKFKSIHHEAWPKYDSNLIQKKEFELVIQINNKIRDKVLVQTGISQKEAEKIALKREKIDKLINSQEIKKIIFAPNRLINLIL